MSLATCTPQPEYGRAPDTYSQWHAAFQETFLRAASDDGLLKHHHAVFVFSNFRFVADEKSGGLSGAFIPVPFANGAHVPDYLTVSVWGQPAEPKQPESWSKPDATNSGTAWRNSGYIASLRATGNDMSARMIGFTVDKFPRQASRWRTHRGLTDFQLFAAKIDEGETQMTFKQQD